MRSLLRAAGHTLQRRRAETGRVQVRHGHVRSLTHRGVRAHEERVGYRRVGHPGDVCLQREHVHVPTRPGQVEFVRRGGVARAEIARKTTSSGVKLTKKMVENE